MKSASGGLATECERCADTSIVCRQYATAVCSKAVSELCESHVAAYDQTSSGVLDHDMQKQDPVDRPAREWLLSLERSRVDRLPLPRCSAGTELPPCIET